MKEMQPNYQEFIKECCKTQKIYALGDGEGFAYTYSTHFENTDGGEAIIVCFWSNRLLAQACQVAEWKSYRVISIDLSHFLEEICVDFSSQHYVIGANFDESLQGIENDPLWIINDFLTELRAQKIELPLQNFHSVEDMYEQLQQILKK